MTLFRPSPCPALVRHAAPRAAMLLPMALLAAGAPALSAEVQLASDRFLIPPGGEAVLEVAGEGAPGPEALRWSLSGLEDGSYTVDAQGRCHLRAPADLARTRMVGVTAHWKVVGAPASSAMDSVAGCVAFIAPDSHRRILLPGEYKLPGPLEGQQWVVLDRPTGQILLEDDRGRRKPWLGNPDRKAPPRPGPGLEACFLDPCALAQRPFPPDQLELMELVIVDRGAHALYRADSKGMVTLLAGTPGQSGYRDGKAAEALLDQPSGAAIGEDGLVYFTEAGNRCIRRVRDGQVERVAGDPKQTQALDQIGAKAGLVQPELLAPGGPSGSLLFLDQHRLRMLMLPSALVTTLAGDGQDGFVDSPPALSEKDGLARMKGCACLRNPSGLGFTDEEIVLQDQDGKEVRLLCTVKGARLGELATVARPGAEPVPESKGEAGLGHLETKAAPDPDGRPGLPDSRLGLAPRRAVLVAGRGSHGTRGHEGKSFPDSGPASQFPLHLLEIVPLADGSVLGWQDKFTCPRCKPQSAKAQRRIQAGACPHRPAPGLYQLHPDSKGRWQYRALPLPRGWDPEPCTLHRRPDGSLWARSSTGSRLWRFHLAGQGPSLALERVEQAQGWDLKALGRRLNQMDLLKIWTCELEDGSLVLANGPNLAGVLPPGEFRAEAMRMYTLPWLSPDQRGCYLPAPGPGSTVYLGPAGGAGVLELDTRTGRQAPLALGELPEGFALHHLDAWRGHLLLSGTTRESGKRLVLLQFSRPVEPGAPWRQQQLALHLEGRSRFYFSPDGDLAAREVQLSSDGIGESQRLFVVPNRLKPVPAPPELTQEELAGAARQAEAAAAELMREAEREEAKEASKPRKTVAEVEEPSFEPEDEPGSDDDPEPEAPAESRSRSQGDSKGAPDDANRPIKRTNRPAARRVMLLSDLAGSETCNPGAAPRKVYRLKPLVGAQGIVDALGKLAASPATFNRLFDQALRTHRNSHLFHNHEFKDSDTTRQRMLELLDQVKTGRRGRGHRFEQSVFGLGNSSVRKMVRCMLARAGEANTRADLEGWDRRSRPQFPFGLYWVDGDSQVANRLVLELRDASSFKHLFDQFDTSYRAPARGELEAARGLTGVGLDEHGQPCGTRGLCVVIAPGAGRIVTLYPSGPGQPDPEPEPAPSAARTTLPAAPVDTRS